MNVFRYLLSQAQFHGAKRLIERKYRNWWALSLLLFFWASCSIILATINRYFANPAFLVVFENANVSLEFPSVFVCPEIEYPEYKIEELLTNLKYPRGMNRSDIKLIIQQLAAFYSPDVTYSTVDLKKIETLLDYNNLDVGVASTRLSLTCEETFLRCRFFGKMVNCSSIFKLELTNFGYCCIFNGRSLRKEIMDSDTHKTMTPPVLPTYGDDGFGSGLMIAVNTSQKLADVDLSYKWIYLEKGLHFAESGGNGTPIWPNMEFWFGYDSDQFLISSEAKNLSPELRQCIMSTKKLKYFPIYSKAYCLLECEMQRTIDRCNCVLFAHPIQHPSWGYCDAQHLLCAKNSAVPYGDRTCKCLPTCDRTVNLVSKQIFPINAGNHTIDPFYRDLDFSKVAIVRAYVANHDSKVYARQSLFDSKKLFSQIGGILNVFFGCSVLSIPEIVQLIWRAYCQHIAVIRNRKKLNILHSITKKKIITLSKKSEVQVKKNNEEINKI